MTDLKMIEQIKKAIESIKDVSNLSPSIAAEKLVELSVLFSSLSEETASAHYWFNVLFNQILESQEKKNATAAKIKAQASNEYKTLLGLQALEKSLEEIIRSLKVLIRTSERDYQISRNQ